MEQSSTLELVVEMEMGLGMGRMLEDEQRALQLALDQLSMLGLGEEQEQREPLADGEEEEEENSNNSNNATIGQHHHHQHHHHQHPHRESYLAALYEGGEAKKRGCNTTECVPVPSSEHVAEIVGRQGEWVSELGWAGSVDIVNRCVGERNALASASFIMASFRL
ncbi:hypothetical protein chiPu_0021327 [Chiloscyllium punctatum]|uniref:K Homology domain-containing protein n=1 Tax=Chiloscyllium punctatum TaxID=137246 RepID=A0A401RQ43_CHIPU|nr:hypothetical protein [Chiloscyllium punctatum]